MITYRIQVSGEGWILRHPDYQYPELFNRDKQALIEELQAYFDNKKPKQAATVRVLDKWGNLEQVLEYK